MFSPSSLKLALVILAATPVLEAGEVLLFVNSVCSKGAIPIVFPSYQSTDCRIAETDASNNPYVYGVTSRRDIGPACTYNLYTDTKCKKLAASLPSAGVVQDCIGFPKGMRSYQITCDDVPSNKPLRILKIAQAPTYSYFQPYAQFRGKPSGHTDILVINPESSSGTFQPTGSPAQVAYAIAEGYAGNIPPTGNNFAASTIVKPSTGRPGTTWTLNIYGYQNNSQKPRKFTAQQAFARIGEALLGSLVANFVETMEQGSLAWYYWGIYDFVTPGDPTIAYFNLSQTRYSS